MFVIDAWLSQIHEQYEDKWEIIRVTHAEMSKEEEDEREEALAEVADPMYLMARGDADAEGDIEVEDTGTRGTEFTSMG
jgi:RNA polymerase II-associated factor 1